MGEWEVGCKEGEMGVGFGVGEWEIGVGCGLGGFDGWKLGVGGGLVIIFRKNKVFIELVLEKIFLY